MRFSVAPLALSAMLTSSPAPANPAPYVLTDSELLEPGGTRPCVTDATLGSSAKGYTLQGRLDVQDGKPRIFCVGARHTWAAGRSVSIREGVIAELVSSATDPLTFVIEAGGRYVYRGGTGWLVTSKGTRVLLPPGSTEADMPDPDVARTPNATPGTPGSFPLSGRPHAPDATSAPEALVAEPLNGILTTFQIHAGAAAWSSTDTVPGGDQLSAAALGFGMWVGYFIDDWAVLGDLAIYWPLGESLTARGQHVAKPDGLSAGSIGVGVARYRLSDLNFNVALGGGTIRVVASDETAEGEPLGSLGPMAFAQVGKDWTWVNGHLAVGLTLRAQYGSSKVKTDFVNAKDWEVFGVLGGLTVSLLGSIKKPGQ